METCLFCRIVAGDLPAEVVYQDDQVIAFNDINPVAPVHVLVVPRKHVADLNGFAADDQNLVGKLVLVAQLVARLRGVADSGYRVLTNCGIDAGQVVGHLHWHVLGGSKLGPLG